METKGKKDIKIKNEWLEMSFRPLLGKNGRPPLIGSPEELARIFVEYAEYAEAHPWETGENVSKSQKKGDHGKESVTGKKSATIKRPLSLERFCSYARIYDWRVFKARYLKKKGFSTVIYAIENYIRSDQLEGAIIGEYKENIIARLIGLKEHQVVEDKRQEDTWTDEQITKEEERARIYLASGAK